MRRAASVAFILVACGGGGADAEDDDPGRFDAGNEGSFGGGKESDSDADDEGGSGGGGAGAGGEGDGGDDACPKGVICLDDPSFPLRMTGNTVTGSSSFDRYSCAESTDEGGPEIVYRLKLPGDGFLSAAVYGDSATVDVDVHLLADNDPSTCLSRGNVEAKTDIAAGYRYVVVDSFVKGGVPQAGPFTLDIGFLEPSVGPCELETGLMPRVNDGGNSLPMPATGPVVKEAHLVTQEEPAPYPTTATEKLAEHYALSQERTGLVMYRKELWAPLEGGTHYGQGIGPATLVPIVDEGWYVNMYWRASARPARGTRMILVHPDDPSRAVVVSAGHETGPGNLSHIGGTTEETHFYLGTGHLSTMKLGIAQDQSLPFGPRRCIP